MKHVIVIGGGAAGCMAAVAAAQKGAAVTLLERNPKLGRKLYITGKGRCNVTNDCAAPEVLQNVPRNSRFLTSAVTRFPPEAVKAFFEGLGVPLKTERGNRVFPVSDHSSDIIRALERELKKAGAQIHLHTEVKEVCTQDEKVTGVLLSDGTFFEADTVVVATGGLSYPSTGSTGDGYRFAAETGHKVVSQSPSLVPLVAKEDYVSKLQGLSLRNVELTVKSGKKVLYKDFGEMMFTHFGVTGPLILSASAQIGKKLEKEPLEAFLDLKPALDAEQLDARILREFDANHNKQFKNVIGVLFPSSLTPIMIEIGGIPGEKPVHEISREERQAFGRLIKAFPFTITGMGEFKEAIITRGGVSVKEIQPSTMESKKVKNLYFTGEVLDLDAVTGGYNLQIAWSTAYAAAQAIE